MKPVISYLMANKGLEYLFHISYKNSTFSSPVTPEFNAGALGNYWCRGRCSAGWTTVIASCSVLVRGTQTSTRLSLI